MQEPIHGLSFEQLESACRQLGQPSWRTAQIWDWLYVKRINGWDDMRNLPRALRNQLADRFIFTAVQPEQQAEATESGAATNKIGSTLADGEVIETVLIPASGKSGISRQTVCVSSQAGCKIHCAFCASGQLGFARNLSTAEIVEQVLIFARRLEAPPTHVVFMGIGEPLDNYDNVLAAIRILNHPDGLRIGARRITISTCGIIPGIQRLAQEGLQTELSVSLHAPDDELRSKLMPVNQLYSLTPLLAACRDYTDHTGRIITFEYTLIDKLNASPEQARSLTKLLRGCHCRVNLIPLSPVTEFDGQPPPAAVIKEFIRILEQAGINATLRASRGAGINAACGQLRFTRAGQRKKPRKTPLTT